MITEEETLLVFEQIIMQYKMGLISGEEALKKINIASNIYEDQFNES